MQEAPIEGTIAAVLAPASVPMPELHRHYGALLELVRRLIGVTPNCDPILEIWPPGFRTYNLMVPAFLNLPALLFGVGAPKDVLGLAMYAASRTAECPYCSAHTCSFAMRRGALPATVATAFGSDSGGLNRAETAAVATAEALSANPPHLGATVRADLERALGPAKAEWLALSVAMMGFLNKFMDAAGVPLESETVAEVGAVIGPSGWKPGKHFVSAVAPGSPPGKDNLGILLGVVRLAPAALRLDRRWTAGVPGGWPAAGQYLQERTGHDFPLLGRMRRARPRRALATMLRDNLDAGTTKLGLDLKALTGLVYATVVEDAELAGEARKLARAAGVADGTADGVAAFSGTPADLGGEAGLDAAQASLTSLPGIDALGAMALVLAKVSSPSPAETTPFLAERAAARLEPAAIVELLVWLSVQQLMHRLAAYLTSR